MILFHQHECCKSEKRGEQRDGNVQLFISFVTETPPHLQCISKYYHALSPHYYQKTDIRIQNLVDNFACPSENLAKVNRYSFIKLVGPARKETNSAIRKLWFSPILVILTEITEAAPLSKPRASSGALTTAIKAWNGQAVCAHSANDEFYQAPSTRIFFLNEICSSKRVAPSQEVCRF